jgi:hypothetical protein
MSFIEVTLSLDKKEYPMLNNLKKKELNNFLLKIFKTGYQIQFPPQNKIEQQVEFNEIIERIEKIKYEIKEEINNSEITNKINALESSLIKLIGLSSNSCKKGNFGENVLEEIFTTRYGDIQFERKSSIPHSGDAWLYLPDSQVIMLESKNYTTTVNKDEINKLQFDMINHHIKWGILTSFNSTIQGMKEMDFHTFSHNNETYFVIMISNLSTDIHKLDLGLQIIRKLIVNIGNLPEFPWIVKDITLSLTELSQIIQKNYFLRDAYYNMERDIQKSLSGYHIILRDYQYDIEQKINEIIDKIQSTMKTTVIDSNKKPNYQEILEKYQDKKILPIIVRLIDIVQSKKWNVDYDEVNGEWVLSKYVNEIGRVKIQQKKAIISIPTNELTLTLNIGKEKENKKNLEIIKSL